MTDITTQLDPVQGFVDYIQDIKPYHTKIMEVLVEYVYEEPVDVTILEDNHLHLTLLSTDHLSQKSCNDGYGIPDYGSPGWHHIASPDVSYLESPKPAIDAVENTITIMGDVTHLFPPGASIYLRSHVEIIDLATLTAEIDYRCNPATGDNSNCINNGIFTVEHASYDPGMIGTWPDVSDFSSYVPGTRPHTVIKLVERIEAPNNVILDEATEKYVMYASLHYQAFDGVLGYSKATHTTTPDEGKLVLEVLPQSFTDYELTVPGDVSQSHVFPGDEILLTNSASNGVYTVDSVAYSEIDDTTKITVNETLGTNIAYGTVTINILSNVIVINNAVQQRFTPGLLFDVMGGSFDGQWTVLATHYINGTTYVRPTKSLINPVNATNIDSVAVYNGELSFSVRGDVRSRLYSTSTFNIIQSDHNDGSYHVSSVSFDPVLGVTIIVPVEPIVNDPSGLLHISTMGVIKEHFFGYSEHSTFCGLVPDTYIHVNFDEYLNFSEIGISVTDDLFVYDMENTDSWGYELPIGTIISASEPVFVESTTPPPSPSINMIWGDTSFGYDIKQWDGAKWVFVKDVYWFNSTNNVLFYRTKTAFLDTGWVLDRLGFKHTRFTYSNDHEVNITAEPHQFFHPAGSVDVLVNPNALVLHGGNFIHKFDSTVVMEGLHTGSVPISHIEDHTIQSINIVDVNADSNSIVVGGDWVWLFEPTGIFRVNPLASASLDYVVDYSIYDPVEDQTVIMIDSATSVNETIEYNSDGSEIIQNHSRDLGWLYCAVCLPGISGTQTKTTVAVDAVIDGQIDSILYKKQGPIHLSVGVNPQEGINANIGGVIQAGDNTIRSVTSFNIIDVDSIDNTIVINAIDPGTGIQVAFPDAFLPGAEFTITNSLYTLYDDDQTVPNPTIKNYTNDNRYVVHAAYGVGADTEYSYRWYVRFDQSGIIPSYVSEAINLYVPLHSVPGWDMSVVAGQGTYPTKVHYINQSNQLERLYVDVQWGDIDGITSIVKMIVSYTDDGGVTWHTYGSYGYYPEETTVGGSIARIIIEVETAPMNIPPLRNLNVDRIEITTPDLVNDQLEDNVQLLPRIVISGNHYNEWVNELGLYTVDVPITTTGTIHIRAVEWDANNQLTYLYIDDEILPSVLYVDAVTPYFSGGVELSNGMFGTSVDYDESKYNYIDPDFVDVGVDYVHGTLQIEGLSISDTKNITKTDEGSTSATIIDTVTFGWGGTYRQPIIAVSGNNAQLTLAGDVTGILDVNDTFDVVGSAGFDSFYTILDISYSPALGNTVIDVDSSFTTPPAIHSRPTIIRANSNTNTFTIDGEGGKHDDFLYPGKVFKVVGSYENMGNYTVASSMYRQSDDTVSVTTVENIPSNSGDGSIMYYSRQMGYISIPNIDVVDWFQFLVLYSESINNTIVLDGDATSDIQIDQVIKISGSASINGEYTVIGTPLFDGTLTTVPVASVDDSVGGWLEPVKDYGIVIKLADHIGTTVNETTNAGLITASSIIDSWEADFWDVGGFDTDSATIIHLYDNNI